MELVVGVKVDGFGVGDHDVGVSLVVGVAIVVMDLL